MYPAGMQPKVQTATVVSLLGSFLVFWLVNKLPFIAPIAEPIRYGVEALITSFLVSFSAWLARNTPPAESTVRRTQPDAGGSVPD